MARAPVVVGPEQQASKVKPLPVKWINESIPQGFLTLVAGKPGEGKSLFAAYLAASLSQAGQDVVFVASEDPRAQMVRPRLETAGADLDKVWLLDAVFPDEIDVLRDVVERRKAKAIIIDPVYAHITATVRSPQQVRTALRPLQQLAEEKGLAVVLIHHTLKGMKANSDPLAVIGGAQGGVVGAVRLAYLFGQISSDIRALVCVKANLGQHPPASLFEIEGLDVKTRKGLISSARLILSETTDTVTPAHVMAGDMGGEDKTVSAAKRALAAEWLVSFLADGPQTAEVIRAAAAVDDISWRTLRRAADDLGIVKRRQGFGKGSAVHWELPEDFEAVGGDSDGS
jgi:putative DNA primase/helicase